VQSEKTAEAQSICNRIFQENNSFIAWHWDDRFNAIVSEVKIENVKQVVEALEKYFDHYWDEKTIAQAPGKIQSLATKVGGVRSGQRLYTSDPDSDVILLSTFWPWQNGTKVSIRMIIDIVDIDMN
jgi:hypothetical protein